MGWANNSSSRNTQLQCLQRSLTDLTSCPILQMPLRKMCGLFVIQPKLPQHYSEDLRVPPRPVTTSHPMRQASTRERVNAIMGTPLTRPRAETHGTMEGGDQEVKKEDSKTSQEVYVSSQMNSYTTLRVEGTSNNDLESQPYHVTARRDLRLKRSMSSPLAETCLSNRVRRQDVYSRRSLIVMPSPISPIKEHDQEHDCVNGESTTLCSCWGTLQQLSVFPDRTEGRPDVQESDTSVESEGYNSASDDTNAAQSSLASSVSVDSTITTHKSPTFHRTRMGKTDHCGQNHAQQEKQIAQATMP